MMAKRFLVLIGALSLAACGQLSKGASRYFVDKYSCPAEKVTVAEKRDARPSEIFAADWRAATPPAEVASDPQRLAQWQTKETERRKSWEAWMNRAQLFEVSGCGHRLVLACRKPGQGSTSGTTANCKEPPGGSTSS
jgi:hypothetical protein